MNDIPSQSLMSLDTATDRLFHRPPAKAMASRLAASWVTPNQLTLASLIPACMATALFWTGTPQNIMIGILLFYFWAVMDHADGELARIKNMTSDFGKKLDDICDNIASTFMLIGIYAGCIQWVEGYAYGWMTLFVLGLLLNSLSGIMVLNRKRQVKKILSSTNKPKASAVADQKLIDHFTGREPFYMLILAYAFATYMQGIWVWLFMAVLLGGCYLMSVVSFCAYVKMKREIPHAN